MSKENPMICDNHISIQLLAGQIETIVLELKDKHVSSNIYIPLTNIEYKIKEILIYSKDATRQGKRMEKRLKKYHDKILSLGFERKRK